MKYLRCRWFHSIPDEPVLLYSELDDKRWEIRKVYIFENGRYEYANATFSTPDTMLSELPIAPLEEIAADPQFEPVEIDQDEFEAVWYQAVMRVGRGDCPGKET